MLLNLLTYEIPNFRNSQFENIYEIFLWQDFLISEQLGNPYLGMLKNEFLRAFSYFLDTNYF